MTWTRRLLAAVLLATLAPAAPASLDGPAWSQIAQAPADADAVVLIDDPAALASSPAGRALRAAIADSGQFAETFKRWGALSQRLGLREDEAFEELLGRRVVLIARAGDKPERAGQPGASSWALITDVSERGEKLIRKRLQAAPRAKIAAQPILAAEHGRFLLALVDRRGADDRRATELIICPDDSEDLLEELVVSRVVGAKIPERRTLGATDAFALTRDLPPGQVLALFRLLRPDGGTMPIAGSATIDGSRCTAQLALDAAHWCPDPDESRLDARVIERLEDGALALVAESLPEGIGAADEPGGQLAVWPAMLSLPGDIGPLVGGRTVVRLDREPSPAESALRLCIASETPAVEDPAAAVDRSSAGMLGAPGEADEASDDFAGQFPRAVRTRPVTFNTFTPLGREALAAWGLGFPGPDASPTWWAMCLTSDRRDTAAASAATRSLAEALAGAAPDPGSRLIAAGLVRPREIHDAVAKEPWASLAPLTAMRHAELLRWRFVAPPRGEDPGRDGLVRGRVDIVMNAAVQSVPAEPDPGLP